MVIKNPETILLKNIQMKLIDQVPMTEEYYKKHLTYKQFKFQEENIEDLSEMLAKIQKLLVSNETAHFLLLERKMLEAQDALIKECEKIYSERINYNEELAQLIKSTIIPYYQGRFEVSLSREISFLPLELRLYIYSTLLYGEASTMRQMHVMDRIALTLHKAEENFLGDVAIFICSWLKFQCSEVMFGRKKDFTSIYKLENEKTHKAASLREPILTDSEMTPEIAGREFWYGLKGFSTASSIHNFEAAKVCFDLFVSYYKGSFEVIERLQPVLHRCYKTKDFKEISKYLEKEGLNEISISKRFNKVHYPLQSIKEFSTAEVEKLDAAQRKYAKENIQNYKEKSYLYLNSSSPRVTASSLSIPENLLPSEAKLYIENLMKILRFKCIFLSDFDKYIMDFGNSIISSEEWKLEEINLVLGLLNELYTLIWLRNKQSKTDAVELMKILVTILDVNRKNELDYVGEGWPIALLVEDTNNSKKSFVLYKSTDTTFPPFIGHIYVGDNPKNLKAKEIERLVRKNALIRVHGSYIERKVGLSKAVLRKRNNKWKEIRKAQETICLNIKKS